MGFLHPYKTLVIATMVIKGMIMAVVAVTVTQSFYESLIVASVSALLSGFFLMVSVFVTVREARSAKKVGEENKVILNKISTDNPAGGRDDR